MTIDLRAKLLATIADSPLQVETRSLLLDPSSQVLGDAGGGAVIDELARLVAIAGRPSAATLADATRRTVPGWAVVAQLDEEERLSTRLAGWNFEPADVFTLPQRVDPPPAAVEVRLLDSAAALDHVPEPLRSELRLALARNRALTAAFAGGRAVSFCYAYHLTETLWDVSIDTLEPYRRRGLAAASAAELIGLMRRRGRQPVWGAVASNVASRRLAERLGFRRVGGVAVWTRDR